MQHPADPHTAQQGLGIGAVTIALLSTQIGAAYAKELIGEMPSPIGAVWLRLAAAGALLAITWVLWWALHRHSSRTPPPDQRNARALANSIAVTRGAQGPDPLPSPTGITPGAQANPSSHRPWLAWTGYGISLLTMNWAIYEAFARIPVGIAVTIEFLGPLTVALISSRRRLDLLWVAAAGVGVALLGLRPARLDPAGVAFAVLAAACWAGYIWTGAKVARRGNQLATITAVCVAGAIIFTVPAGITGQFAALNPRTIWLGILVGLTCSALPYTLELLALGRIRSGLFAILESLAPAVAALASWVIIHERLGGADWAAIALIVAASIGASLSSSRLN